MPRTAFYNLSFVFFTLTKTIYLIFNQISIINSFQLSMNNFNLTLTKEFLVEGKTCEAFVLHTSPTKINIKKILATGLDVYFVTLILFQLFLTSINGIFVYRPRRPKYKQCRALDLCVIFGLCVWCILIISYHTACMLYFCYFSTIAKFHTLFSELALHCMYQNHAYCNNILISQIALHRPMLRFMHILCQYYNMY